MSDYDIRPKPKVGSPNECRTFGRTAAECCRLVWTSFTADWWVGQSSSMVLPQIGLTKSRPHDDRAARLHTPRTCLITTAHRWLALINRLCGIVRPHIATAQQMMYAFHGPFIYYNRICIGVKNTQIKMQMYQLMLALFGRLICWRLQELKCDSCNK